ncbi:calcium/proton exchanger [Tanacetum coccineum]
MAKGITGSGQGFDLRGKRLGGYSRQPPLSSLRQKALSAPKKRVQRGTLLAIWAETSYSGLEELPETSKASASQELSSREALPSKLASSHGEGEPKASWECGVCQPKKKKAKKDVFTVYFNYDGIFTSFPLKYSQGQMKELNDTNFDEMSYEHLKEIALRLIPHACFEKIYYCQTGAKLSLGVRELKSTQDIADMLKVGYDNGNEIDMYVEHFGYDIMELAELERNEEQNHNSIESSDDEYYGSDDCEEIENVDFQTEGESVVIKNISTHDLFLNKLCSARIMFRGTGEHHETETPLVDPDENQIDSVNKVQSDVFYLAFNPNIHWDKMEPTLGMRYETPHQFITVEMWKMEDVQIGVKKKVVRKKVVKKKVVKKKPVSNSKGGTRQSPKWTKKQVRESKQFVCPFRIYASWMSNEHSFQIKSLISEHKCCRNYNLGSLVSYRWIVLQFFKEIIEDPFMSLRKMRDDIRQNFMTDYRQSLLDSNPGSTCRLDVDESVNGSATFRRIYICFKGVKDGWLAGCRKVRNTYNRGLIQAIPTSLLHSQLERRQRLPPFEEFHLSSREITLYLLFVFNRTMVGVDVDTLTMEQYLALSRENQAPGVVNPEIGGNVNFEIKSQFMRELREDTFSRNKDGDAHDHIDRVLSIFGLFNIPGVSKDAVMLRVFPFTLTGAAKRWVNRLVPGTINTWDLLKKAFIQRYCPPSMTAKQLEDIHNFKQEGDESLYQAWERYNDLLYKCPTHYINSHQKVNIFYKGLSTMNRQLLDSQGPIIGMRPAQALTAIQTMADHSQKWHDGTTSSGESSSSIGWTS